MSNWYVFYVQTGKEQTACNLLNKLFNQQESIAFIPQIEFIFRNSASIHIEYKPMFPGYVFTDSELNEINFIKKANKYIRFAKCIFKLLGNNNIDYVKLSEAEKNFLLSFYDKRYIAEKSIGFIIGDKVSITSGALLGKESIIKKIDRHKRHAEIEMEFFGQTRRIKVSLEIISRKRMSLA